MNRRERRKVVRETNSNEAQNYFLALARETARRRGLIISFEGLYSQRRKWDPQLKSQTPFVIAHDEESLRKLREGILEALIFEIGHVGEIKRGVIRPEKIEFQKVYIESVHPSVTIHKTPIHYFGKSNNSGEEYVGEWRVPNDSFKDMCESGTFQIVRTYHE